ncbi:MAG: hypothetical protein AAF550_11280 [Myxococcota bacterium]
MHRRRAEVLDAGSGLFRCWVAEGGMLPLFDVIPPDPCFEESAEDALRVFGRFRISLALFHTRLLRTSLNISVPFIGQALSRYA